LNVRTQRSKASNELSAIIDTAKQDGNVELINSSVPEVQQFEAQIPLARFSVADLTLLSNALRLKSQMHEARIATFDTDIIAACQGLGISVLQDDEIQLFIQFAAISAKKTACLMGGV
jgi:hypothetical protein